LRLHRYRIDLPDPLEELEDDPPPPELEELLLPPCPLLLLLLPPLLLLDELELLEVLELLDEELEGGAELEEDAGGVELDDDGDDSGRFGPDTFSLAVHPTRAPKPARALTPESTFRNSRRSSRSCPSALRGFFGIGTSGAGELQVKYQARRSDRGVARRGRRPFSMHGFTGESRLAHGVPDGAVMSGRDRSSCGGPIHPREFFAGGTARP
jgi:hypothetical protein